MDNFTNKLLDKPIEWKSNNCITTPVKELIPKLNWDEIENLYWECQLQDQASNVTNVMNESYVSELNLKIHQLIRTNRQSSASDIAGSEITQEINDENKEQLNEIPSKPQLKRANTLRSHNKSFTEMIREKEKFKRYRNNRKSARTLSMICLKRSLITSKLLNPSKESKNHVCINYLNTNYSKSFKIDKEMLVCELIVLAINEYKNTQDLDQSLLKYSNFTLAYQLISYDDNCDFSAFTSKRNSYEEKNPVQQFQYIFDDDQSIQDRRIEFDLATKITFHHYTLMVTEINQYGLDLGIIQTTQQFYPNLIIILIEDEKNKTLYNLRCDPKGNVESIHEELSKKASFKFQKNEFYFTLKYPCVNFIQAEPVPQELPIQLLPIHWLVINYKFYQNTVASSGSLNFRDLQIQSEGQLSTKKSQKFYQFETKDKPEMLHQMFNYEEYQFLKIEDDGCINQISLGIDYFDIYYYYTGQKNRKCTLSSLAKSFVKVLLKDAYSGQSKDYKRIPMTSVLEILEKKSQNIFEVKYKQQDSNIKSKLFTIPETQENNNNEILNQYKLSLINAIKKLNFIIEKRKNNLKIE